MQVKNYMLEKDAFVVRAAGRVRDLDAEAPLTQALDEWQIGEDGTPFGDDAVIEFAAAIRDLGGELSSVQEQKVEAVRQNRIRLFERRNLSPPLICNRPFARMGLASWGATSPAGVGAERSTKSAI